ncbi:MAG: ABC transporter permease, partial [Clostridia bacterium]
FCGNQTVSGTAINFLAPGLALFLCRLFFDGAAMTKTVALESKIPKYLDGVFVDGSFMAKVFNQDAAVYLALLAVLGLWFLLYHTRFGLRVRAIGEHPRAADTLGVRVGVYRYVAVILSGFLAGVGGASLSIGVSSTYMIGTVSGQGFIAMAAMIFGKWKPQGALGACLIFGAAQALVVYLGWPGRLNISADFLSMIPYLLTLAILMGLGKTVAPAADGQPYEKS